MKILMSPWVALSQLFEHQSVGLYRNDGRAILKGLPGPETERVKKKVIKVFKDSGLQITNKANLHIVNFLDITFGLRNYTNEPYRKPTIILYTSIKTLAIQKQF